MKKLLILSDLHCGSELGLTPPSFFASARTKLGKAHREMWAFFRDQVRASGPHDIIVVNGDLIDGDGHFSGGTEELTTDRMRQAEMAASVIAQCASPQTKLILISYGTGAHTGRAEDFEDHVVPTLQMALTPLDCEAKIEIKSTLDFEVEGVVFNIRHHIGRSTVPHGRASAPLKELLWNELQAARGKRTKSADVLVRSHVHYFCFAGDRRSIAMTSPALRAAGGKFGERVCSGDVDFGFLTFEVENGDFIWKPHIATLESEIIKPVVIE